MTITILIALAAGIVSLLLVLWGLTGSVLIMERQIEGLKRRVQLADDMTALERDRAEVYLIALAASQRTIDELEAEIAIYKRAQAGTLARAVMIAPMMAAPRGEKICLN